VDQVYYEKFSALVEEINVPVQLRDAMTKLAAAGRRGDTALIKQNLPDVYEAIIDAMRKEKMENERPQNDDTIKGLTDTLKRLREYLDKGDNQNASAAMEVLRTIDSLNDEARELYFFLNDALLLRKTEKAAGGLALWMKIFGRTE
jgi:hypothetical protein